MRKDVVGDIDTRPDPASQTTTRRFTTHYLLARIDRISPDFGNFVGHSCRTTLPF
jgi:hypothetical protein